MRCSWISVFHTVAAHTGSSLSAHDAARTIGYRPERSLSGPTGSTEVVFHYRGAQYTSGNIGNCAPTCASSSRSEPPESFDNAPYEAFLATLNKELVHRVRFATRAEAKRPFITWIEGVQQPESPLHPRLHLAGWGSGKPS